MSDQRDSSDATADALSVSRRGFLKGFGAGTAATALLSPTALREAEEAGYRFGWRYVRDLDPDLASIRNEPEFKAVFADIERDMARQRAELAARPKNAPLDLNTASN